MRHHASRLVDHVRNWPRRLAIAVGAIAVVLIAVRVALPLVIEKQVNDRLQSIPGYAGRVDDIDLHLWRGAYSLHGVGIYREHSAVRHPFFLARHIDFSIAWRELFRGRIVSDIYVDEGQLIFVKGPTEATSTTDTDRRWQAVAEDLFPIHITQFELDRGVLRYVDSTRDPKVDLFIKNMRVVAAGLRNRAGEGRGELPAQITITGDSLGGGQVDLQLAAEPLAAQPHFHLSFRVDGVNLPALNDSLRAYANVDVGRGMFRMAAEMAARDGGFQGYVKPFFEDIDFQNLTDGNKGLGGRIWERVVAGLAWLVKNKARDQVATRIPFSGRFGDPEVGLLATIANLFRHGFVQAFNPTVEGSIDPAKVLPTGKSADGSDVAEPKSDAPAQPDPKTGAAGEPTGRPPAPKTR